MEPSRKLSAGLFPIAMAALSPDRLFFVLSMLPLFALTMQAGEWSDEVGNFSNVFRQDATQMHARTALVL